MDLSELQALYHETVRVYRGGRATRKGMLAMIEEYGGCHRDIPTDSVVVWSDLHIGHENIIDYAGRPYRDVIEMDQALWANWMSAMVPGTTMVLVGDVALRTGVADATWKRIGEMPGHKILIFGNHDIDWRGGLRTHGFDETWAFMVSEGDPPLVWTHYPLSQVPDGSVNIHGHTHQTTSEGRYINVSVEQLAYRPVQMGRLIELAKVLVMGETPSGTTTLDRLSEISAYTRDF